MDAGLGLDQGNDQGAFIQRFDLLNDRTARIVIMGYRESQPPRALWTVSAPRHNIFRLSTRFNQWHHDAHGASVQDRRNQMPGSSGDTNNRHDRCPAGCPQLRFDDIDANAAVFHVKHHKLSARLAQNG